MDKIVVFGATGTLGTYLVDELHKQNKYHIIACGYRNIIDGYYRERGIQAFQIDITDSQSLEKLPYDNIKAVIDLAGVMPSRMEGYNPELYLKVNAIGSFNILNYCRKVGTQKFIFTQSHSDVAGYWNTGIKIPPNASRKINYKGDHAVYSITKNTAVDLSEHYFQEYGIKNIIFRLPTIYSYRPIYNMYVEGKLQPLAYRYLINKALKGEDLEIWGDPHRLKDIVYVKDFTQMVIKSIAAEKARGFYNVAYGQGVTLEHQIKGIADVFGPPDKEIKIIYKPEKPSQNSYLYDISNAKDDLDYKPEYSYLNMLKDMKAEMVSNRFQHLENKDVNYR